MFLMLLLPLLQPFQFFLQTHPQLHQFVLPQHLLHLLLHLTRPQPRRLLRPQSLLSLHPLQYRLLLLGELFKGCDFLVESVVDSLNDIRPQEDLVPVADVLQ